MLKKEDLLLVGKLSSPHGVKGLAKLLYYFDSPDNFHRYSAFYLSDCSEITLDFKFISKKHIVVEIPLVQTREQLEAFINKDVFINKAELKEPEKDEFYHIDLIGCDVLENSRKIGEVLDINNFGAGDLLEIKFAADGKTQYFIFNDENFPKVDVGNNKITINRPEEVTDN